LITIVIQGFFFFRT